MTALPHPTAHTTPPPVLFNAWKHHALWLRERIVRASEDDDLRALASQVVVIGSKVMDTYTGMLTPWQVGEQVLYSLQTADRLPRALFDAWVATGNGYRLLDLSDGSRWVVRAGDSERYVHIHPARYSRHSLRIAGLTLKTAVLATTLAVKRRQAVADLTTVNEVRRLYLCLPPMAHLTPDGGVGRVLQLLAVVR